MHLPGTRTLQTLVVTFGLLAGCSGTSGEPDPITDDDDTSAVDTDESAEDTAESVRGFQLCTSGGVSTGTEGLDGLRIVNVACLSPMSASGKVATDGLFSVEPGAPFDIGIQESDIGIQESDIGTQKSEMRTQGL